MKISVIQSKQYSFYSVDDPKDFTLEKCIRQRDLAVDEAFYLMEKAGVQGADLIVTTEALNISIMSNDPRYSFLETAEPLNGMLIERFCKLACKHRTYIVGGLITRIENKAYNSAILFSPKGDIKGIYHKTHPAFGENVTPGKEYPVFKTEFGNLGMLICWDMQYPEAVRELALKGVDLIACPTWGWENIYGVCRAYENSIYIASAMALPPHGVLWDGMDPSCIVDPMGKIVSTGSHNETGIITADLNITREPDFQYGIRNDAGYKSMRQIRMMLRRPATYTEITQNNPDVMKRYC